MIGIVIVTHCRLAHELIETAKMIIGSPLDSVIPVSINIEEKPEKLREKIAKIITKVNQDKGILILTDMFGGTPSNLSYSFLEEGSIEVISGVNLPILIKAINSRHNMELAPLAKNIESYGKRSISLASSILKGNKRS
jgi:mannose PTS system EIIA component